MVVVCVLGKTRTGVLGRAGLSGWYIIYIYIYATGIKTISEFLRPAIFWTLFGLLVLVCMCLCFRFVGVCLRMLAREIIAV